MIQAPGFVGVKVGVAPHPRAGVVGVGQGPPLPVEQGHVAVETRSEQQQDVGERCRGAAVAADDDAVVVVVFVVVVGGYFLEGEGRGLAPHIEGPAEGGGRTPLPQGGGDILLQQAGESEGKWG